MRKKEIKDLKLHVEAVASEEHNDVEPQVWTRACWEDCNAWSSVYQCHYNKYASWWH